MSSTTNAPVSAPAAPAVKKRRFRFVRLAILLVLICAAALAVPPVFQFAVKQGLPVLAWKHGASLTIEKVEGSLWEPLRLRNSRFTETGRGGTTTRLEIARAEAQFAWSELLKQPTGRWFKELSISGVRGKVDVVADPDARLTEEKGETEAAQIPFPEQFEATDVDLMIATGNDYVHLRGADLMLSEWETGTLAVEQIGVKQAWFSRTFRDVRGTSAIKGQTVVLADLKLEPEITIESISAKAADLANGMLNAEVHVVAFGGDIRGQARGLMRERQHGIEAGANFSQISVAKLATFLGVTDAAGGTIKEGKLTFRGNPRNFPKSSATLRISATNFQWESRQWDSLVFGAVLLDKRVQIPELELHQGHNHLSLNGEMALPVAKTPWWQSEFSFNVSAKIENLTELSQLVLPEFQYTAGKVNIDGAVRGKSEQFHGALIVSGTDLMWRKTPIEELHAAVKITGNELQVANFELLNKDDFVRGRGVVNILGAKQYWGELRASVDELGNYAELLKRPIVPESLAGGGTINWTGEGSAKGHTGTFSARLQNLRTLGATAAFIHPLRAHLEGAYSPGSIQFTQFALSDESSAFRANVSVGNKALSLQQIQLTHGSDTWLEGDAILPLDVWQTWPNTDIKTLLTEGIPAKINLVARQLQLREASRLTGWNWPVAGVVDGEIKADGPIGKMQTSGRLTLRDGSVPSPASDKPLENVAADLALEGQTLAVNSFACTHASGAYKAAGSIDFTNVRDTTLKLAVSSEAATIRTFEGIALPIVVTGGSYIADHQLATVIPLTAKLEFAVAGPASAATVSGSVTPLTLHLGGIPELARIWAQSTTAPLATPFQSTARPWNSWKLDLAVKNEAVAIEPVPEMKAAIDLKLSGVGSNPEVVGTISASSVADPSSVSETSPDQLTLTFRPGHASNPTVEIVLNERLADTPISAHISGPWTNPLRTYDAAPPLTPEIAKAFFDGTLSDAADDEPVIRMKGPAVLGGDSPVFEWAPIPDAPASPSTPAEPAPADPSAPAPPAPSAAAPAASPAGESAPAPASPISNQ